MLNHQYLCQAEALHCLSMWSRSHSRPPSGAVAMADPNSHCSPQLSKDWPGSKRAFFWKESKSERERESERDVLGWVVLWSQQQSKKRATAQGKHKQGHPLGRLTPRACVAACQPRLWPGGVCVAAEHPNGHLESMGLSLWKVCISQHGAHRG